MIYFLKQALMTEDEKLLTVNEAAELLKVSVFTVRRYIKEGSLLAIKQKKGRNYFYLIKNETLHSFMNDDESQFL